MSSTGFHRVHRVPNGWRARSALVLALGLLAGACSSAASPAAFSADGGDQFGNRGTAAGAPEPAASAAPPADGESLSGAGGPGSTPADVIANESFIVKTGSITIEVPALDAAVLKARTAITGLGGYISGSDQASDGDQVLASVTYRIPASRWDDAIDAITKLATKVVGLKTGTSEVTGQVLDLGARIDNLRATEQALQAIMVKATRIQDILDVQNQLTGVRGQIEQLTTEQAHLKDQAALSTLTVQFQTPSVAAVKETSQGWDPAAEFDRAASQLLGLGQGAATAGIWFAIVVLPVLILLAILLGILGFIGRRIGWGPFGRSGASGFGGSGGLGGSAVVTAPIGDAAPGADASPEQVPDAGDEPRA